MSFLFPILLLPCTFALAPISRSMISLNFCCEEGMSLITENVESTFGLPRTTAKCAPNEHSHSSEGYENYSSSPSPTDSLEWQITSVKEDGEIMEMSIRKSSVMDVNCYNTNSQELDVHISESDERASQNRSQRFDIRLSGGYSDNEGNVLVNGQPICDDSWDMDDANVACRMLGFEGAEDVVCCSEFGSHGSTFIMDNLVCNGHEDSLFECDYDRSDDCGSSETAGVRCRGSVEGPGPTGNFLKSDGGIVNHLGGTWEANSFCLSRLSPTRISALQCLPAKTVLPSLLDFLWTSFNWAGGDNMTYSSNHSNPRHPHWYSIQEHVLNHGMVMMDGNDDFSISREEFDVFIYEKVDDFFGLPDNYIGAEGKFFNNLPFKLFDLVLDNIMQLVDTTGDGKIALDDLGYEPNQKLTELTGTPMIALPGPLYKLYTLIDADQKEDISLQEAKKFLQATFSILDGNNDCKLSLDEIENGIALAGLPPLYGAAIRGMAQTYVTLGDFIIWEFFEKTREDGKTFLESIKSFADWEWLEESVFPLAINIGYPNLGQVYLLSGEHRFGGNNDYRERNRRMRELHGVLLTALHTIMENPAYANIGAHCDCSDECYE